MAYNLTKLESIIFGTVATFAATAVFLFAYIIVGMFTGVIGGMCSFAPEWWTRIYLWLFVPVPFLGIVAGIIVGLRHSKNSDNYTFKLK
jgi:hypothetical protein